MLRSWVSRCAWGNLRSGRQHLRADVDGCCIVESSACADASHSRTSHPKFLAAQQGCCMALLTHPSVHPPDRHKRAAHGQHVATLCISAVQAMRTLDNSQPLHDLNEVHSGCRQPRRRRRRSRSSKTSSRASLRRRSLLRRRRYEPSRHRMRAHWPLIYSSAATLPPSAVRSQFEVCNLLLQEQRLCWASL